MTPAAVLSILVKAQGVRAAEMALEGVDKTAQKASASTDKAGKAMGFAFKAMAVGALGVGAGLAGAVKASADFEKQMSNLKAVTGSSAATMAQFKKQAIDAGIKTAFSAKQAAEAQTELAKGGLSVANIMSGGLNSALSLAAAGNMDLADAAATTANAMNLFGINGAKSTMVADQLAMAANATTADVGDFSEALKQGGSVAKSAGLSFTDTNVALEALASAGIKGADAGTSLKTSLLQLIAPTSKQATLAKKLGLNFLDQHGKMKSLVDISAMLRAKTGDMTSAQRTATLATLAGTDGVRTLTSLYDAGPKKLEGFRKGLEKQGTAAKVAATMQDNLAGKFEQFKGTIETIAIVVGDKLRPTVQKVVVALTDFANGLLTGSGAGGAFRDAVVNAFTAVKGVVMGVVANVKEFVQEFQDGQGKAVALGAALVGLAAGAVAVQAIGAATKAWAAAQVVLDAAMAANPVVLVIAGLVALGAALVVAYKKSETFRNIVNGVFATVKSVAGAVIGWLVGAFNTVVDEVSQWKVLFETIAVGWKIVTAYWKAEFVLIVAVVKAAIAVISAVVRAGMAVLGPIVSSVWGGLKVIIKGALDVIVGIVKVFGGLLKGDFSQIWDGVKLIFKGAWEVLKGSVETGIGTVLKLVRGLSGRIVTALGDLGKVLLGAGRDLIGGLVSGIKGAVGEITGAAAWLKDQVVAAVKKAFGIHSPSTVMAELGGHMASGLIKGVLGGNIMGFIKSHLGGVNSLAKGMISKGIVSVGSLPGKALSALGLGGGGGGGGESSSSGLVAQVVRALAWARSHGWGGTVTSGFRSNASQQYLWDHADQLGLIRGVSVAAPGTSEHERGRAVDVTDIQGFMRAMASAPANAKLIWRGSSDPVHFSVSGHALGTMGAARGWAWVGEQGPELMKMKGGETVLSHPDSMKAIGGYANGTVSPSVLAQIRRIQAGSNTSGLSTTSAFTTMKGLTGLETAPEVASVVDAASEALRAAVAVAALTPDLADDIAAASAVVAHAQTAFNNAQASGNSTTIADTAGDLKTARDNLKALTDALNENTDALNGVRADLEKQRADEATRSLAVSQSQYGILAKAISDISNGGIGQRLGLSLSGLRAPAGAVSRI